MKGSLRVTLTFFFFACLFSTHVIYTFPITETMFSFFFLISEITSSLADPVHLTVMKWRSFLFIQKVMGRCSLPPWASKPPDNKSGNHGSCGRIKGSSCECFSRAGNIKDAVKIKTSVPSFMFQTTLDTRNLRA